MNYRIYEQGREGGGRKMKRRRTPAEVSSDDVVKFGLKGVKETRE